jgi:5-(carboxyamino)imidazole ribonucleotide mutase
MSDGKALDDRHGKPLVSIVMGSTSDWETMRHADETLDEFAVPHECLVVSAHRTPEWMRDFAHGAEGRGIEVIIAGAGGAAHLPGMVAAQTVVPVLGVPVESRALKGMDSLLSIVQMPGGVPVGTLAIGRSGAKNAALLAVAILANHRPELRDALHAYREAQTRRVRETPLPETP